MHAWIDCPRAVRLSNFSATANLLFHAQALEKTTEYGTQAANHTRYGESQYASLHQRGWLTSWRVSKLGTWGVGELGSWGVGELESDPPTDTRNRSHRPPISTNINSQVASRYTDDQNIRHSTHVSPNFTNTPTPRLNITIVQVLKTCHICVEAKLLSTTRLLTTVPRT